MRSIFAIAVATATASTINAIVLPPTDQRPAAAELPEGFFYGYNNPDGTSTLHFPDTRENITFNPTPAPLPADLTKRQNGLITYGCWSGTLDRSGVDEAMNQMRTRLDQTPIGVGQYSDWPPYFGYNVNGVYVYACENSGSGDASYAFKREQLDWMSYRMDQRCGAYVPGFVEESLREVPTRYLFGKARSGTAVCQGNWRSPR
jgi:hypothetical protein